MSTLVAITVTHVLHSALGRGETTACGIRIRTIRDGGPWLVGDLESIRQSHGGTRWCKRCQAMSRDVT